LFRVLYLLIERLIMGRKKIYKTKKDKYEAEKRWKREWYNRNSEEVKKTRMERYWEKWERICPTCKKLLPYTDYRNYWTAKKKNVNCKSCSKMGNKSRKGQITSASHRLNLSKALKGRHILDEWKQKMRQAALNRIKQFDVKPYTNFNPDACKYFDKLNEENNWKLQHALNGGEIHIIGYSLDAYDKDRNIVVEYDEPRHNKPSVKEKDMIRQNNIIKHLKCKFYRFSQSKNELVSVI